MPELPQVAIMKRHLEDCIVNRVIGHVDVRHDYDLDAPIAAFERRLRGARIEGVRRHGDLLFLQLDSAPHLMIMFGANGHATAVTDAAAPPRAWKVRFELDGGWLLSIDYAKPIGRIDFVDDIDDYLTMSGVGPDALADDTTFETFCEALAGAQGPIKRHLVDPRRIAGIGPLFSDEILFQARLHPLTPAESLTPADLRAMYDAMRETLATAIEHGGEPHRYPDWMLTRWRFSNVRTNPETGGTFTKEMVAGTTSYFDPELQKLAR